MIEKIWKDIIASDESDMPLVCKDEVEEVISIMIEKKIDPLKFGGNLQTIITGGMSSVSEFFDFESAERFPTTASINHFKYPENRPSIAPLWLMAGFPDVMKWYQDILKSMIDPSALDDGIINRTAILYGITVEEAQNITEGELLNDKGQIRARYYRNIINRYKDETGIDYEVAVGKGSPNDIYLGTDILNALGEESNFTLIANKTIKYYLELKKNYSRCLPDESALLSIAGIIDASYYIFVTKQIKPEEIIAIAQQTKNSSDRILMFIILFESLLFSVESPEISYVEVMKTCDGQSKSIKSVIEKTIASYICDSKIAQDVHLFMNNPQLSRIRKGAGACSDSILDIIKKIFRRRQGQIQ